MPRADHTVSKEQRPEADINIEFQSNSKMADESQKLAWMFANANEKFATDYPATVGRHMLGIETSCDAREHCVTDEQCSGAWYTLAREGIAAV